MLQLAGAAEAVAARVGEAEAVAEGAAASTYSSETSAEASEDGEAPAAEATGTLATDEALAALREKLAGGE